MTAFALLVLVCAGLLTVDRTNLLDNDNYLNYFRLSGPDQWAQLFVNSSNLSGYLTIFTEEIVWRLYTFLCSLIFDEENSVVVTTILISTLLFAACARTNNALIAFGLWVVYPIGLATLGLYQIRQGLAFSIFAFFMSRNRVVLGALLAAGIHTTFVVPLIAILALKFTFRLEKYTVAASTGAIALAFFIASAGEYLFLNFGGRRIGQYDTSIGAESASFAIFAAMLTIVYFLNFIRLSKDEASKLGYYSSYLGMFTSAFILISFFIFPLGTSRVGYFAYLFLMFIFSSRGAFRSESGNFRFVHFANWGILCAFAYIVIKGIINYAPYA